MLERFRKLISASTLDIRNNNKTPLIKAAGGSNNFEVVKLLIENGAVDSVNAIKGGILNAGYLPHKYLFCLPEIGSELNQGDKEVLAGDFSDEYF